ncbi:MAG: MGMT family protein [Candidatus Aenigmatarchaeota archaeon]
MLEILMRIPKGKVSTYKELAKKLGTNPRTAGAMLRANKNLKYPCYKIVMSSGRVGGYNRGMKKKIGLLKKDGIEIRNGRINLKRHFFRLG